MKLKDIARATGVSTATVSRVLSGKDNVSEKMRQKVLQAVEKLNYRPNRAAQSLRSKRSSFIGLIVADIQSPYFASLCRAVEDVALQNNFSVILCNTDENTDKERMYLDMMYAQNAAGIILAPTLSLSEQFTDEHSMETPMVVIDRQVRGSTVDMVLIDNVLAARELTVHVARQGYQRVAGLFGKDSTTGRQRRAGFEQGLHEAGSAVIPELIVDLPAKEEDAHKVMTRLLALAEPPDAVITSSGLLAAGAFRAIRDRELPVPEAIAFATFDESLWTAMTRPSITVVEQPTYAIGQTACEMLFKRIEDPTRPTRQVVLSSKLVVRQSCGALRAATE
ncbi:LacI family DNA-binding transcriptional regulator [Pseudodesulfovibrio sediminis]|uniref:LacI family transcriptional regulator n=1 Tax=Pseudodesulfovibrio sediminis TaxID=2810563 RepID=A0ABM7P9T3_9BACT|nr:LacI family DNA-binding transcriptional regulator [Pseudodesulfovibrio sediminis]BCS89885.1 LacI family transcriptional regulator [Pseudodesulfovibrio sediminis]